MSKKRFHKKHALPLACVVLAVVLGIGAFFTTKHFSNAQTPEVKPAGPYIDLYWPDEGYASREWEFTPLSDSPEGYFWAHQQGFVDGEGFYVGMQHPTEGKRKLLLFSVWEALGASADGTNGGWCQTFGGEGEGYSCRRYYDWVEGRTYAFTVEQIAPGWWGAWMRDNVTNETVYLGKIEVPKAWGGLSGWSVMWTEFFGSAQLNTCEDIPYAKGLWGKVVSDGNRKPEEVTYRITENSCRNNTKNVPGSKGHLQEMGVAAKGRGLRATYFPNFDFTGIPVKQIDETINFSSFMDGIPAKGIDPRSFSVRWEGYLSVPKSGVYTFLFRGTGVARLWVNNQLVAGGKLTDSTIQAEAVTLQKDKLYPVKGEYANTDGDAMLTLVWRSPGLATARVPQYYFVPDIPNTPSGKKEVRQSTIKKSGLFAPFAKFFNCTNASSSSFCEWLLGY